MKYKYGGANTIGSLVATIKRLLVGKVDKVDGKGLSDCNFELDEKVKLGGVDSGAQKNEQSDWLSTGGDDFIKNKPTSLPADGGNADTVGGFKVEKAVPANAEFTDTVYNDATINANIKALDDNKAEKSAIPTVPTKLSGFVNDKDFQTGSQVDSKVNAAVANIAGKEYKKVTTLPDTGSKDYIYLVPSGASGTNHYDEFIWIDNAFEPIGTTKVDLSGCVMVSDMVEITPAEVEQLFEG